MVYLLIICDVLLKIGLSRCDTEAADDNDDVGIVFCVFVWKDRVEEDEVGVHP